MNILIVHNIYSSKGGEEGVIALQEELLRSKGHNVMLYTREHSEMKKWLLSRLGGLFTSIYNPKSHRDLKKIISSFKPDIAILHNLFPIISPSIIPFLNKNKIPVWQIVHNYRLLCPIGIFYTKGEICEDCLGCGREWNCLKNNCTGSYFASFTLALRGFITRKLKYYNKVDYFYTLSLFQKNKLIDNGFPLEKIRTVPNTFMPKQKVEEVCLKEKEYIGFVGRLTKEKGLFDFIEIARQMPEYSFRVAGEKTKESENIDLPSNIKFEGFLNQKQMAEFYKKTKIVLFLSRWYEGFPLVLLEAMYNYTPIIVNNLSVMAEVVEDRKEGFIVEIGDTALIKQHIEEVFSNKELYKELTSNARMKFENKYSIENYYKRLMQENESLSTEKQRKEVKK